MVPVSAKRKRKISGAITQVDAIVSGALVVVLSGEVVAGPPAGAADERAATLLGLTRFQLYSRLKRYQIEVSPE